MGLSIWIVIVVGGLITYLIRLSFIVLLERMTLPDWFLRALRYVPAAVLSAIIVPELAHWDGQLVNLSLQNPQLIAGTAAILAAWRTRSVLITLGVGLVFFFVANSLM